jgi:hypothetical protein
MIPTDQMSHLNKLSLRLKFSLALMRSGAMKNRLDMRFLLMRFFSNPVEQQKLVILRNSRVCRMLEHRRTICSRSSDCRF